MAFYVTDRKFYNQLVNGEDFLSNTGTYTTYLKCNAPELVKAVITCNFAWSSSASDTNVFVITANSIVRNTGSFLDDGFIAGDIIDLLDVTTPVCSDRNVTFVNDTTLIFDGAAFSGSSANYVVRGKTALRGFKFNYNLIENNASKDFANLQDGSLMSWSVEGVGAGSVGARSTSLITASWNASSLSGKTGSFKIKFVQDVDAYTQQFQFEHVFRAFPYFLDSERVQFLAGDNIGVLQNNGSFKYIFDLKGGTTSQNPNEIKIVEDSDLLGNTGGFEETFNGGLANFEIESIAYTDSVTGLTVAGIQTDGLITTVTAIIKSSTGIGMNYNHACMVYLSKLTADADILTTSDFETNFIFDSKRQVRGSAAVDGTIIQDLVVSSYSGGTKLQVVFNIDFSAGQETLLVNDDDYAVMIAVDDLNNLGIYRTTTLDTQKIIVNSDTAGLYQITSHGFYRQDMSVGVATPYTDYIGSIEDTIVLQLGFALDTTLSARIKEMRFQLIALNVTTEDHFIINEDKVGFNTALLSGDTQQISITKAQPFQTKSTGSFKNITVLNSLTIPPFEIYRVRYPFKLNWMDYKALPAADGVFFDTTKLNDGLNQDISRYSGVSDYEILMQIQADVLDEDDNITTYQDRTPYIDVYGYEDDGALNAFSSLVITTHTLSGTAIPDNQILKDRDNLIRATYTYTSPISSSITINGLIRIEKYQLGGLSIQQEINSWEAPVSTNTLQPKSGDTMLDVVNNGTTVVMECIIPEAYAKLFSDLTVAQISSRIMTDSAVLANAKQKEDGTLKQKEDGNYKFKE